MPTTEGQPISRQASEAVVSWSHSTQYNEDNPGGWLLFHTGNVMVRGSDAQRTTSHGDAPSGNVQGNGLDVRISFGGENPHWCDNIVVDFSALAPMFLSWEIVRVVLIGNRNGKAGAGIAHERAAAGAGMTPQREERVIGVQHGNAPEVSGGSPLSKLPPVVIDVILEFSQPTLVRPPVEGEALQQGGEGGVEGNINAAAWTVF